MGLLSTPTRILGLGGRALGAGLSAALHELRGGDAAAPGQPPAAATPAEPPAQPAPPPPRRRQASRTPKDLDDVTIARKVETRIFRGKTRHDLKAHIDVNAVDGVVYLRGVAGTPDLINTLEAETRAIPEVKGVENLLHLPHTPSPTRTDTPASQRKTRRSPARKPRSEPRRLNADTSSSEQGDAPETLARTKRGRKPAAMGSSEATSTGTSDAPDAAATRFRRDDDADPVAGARPGTEQPATTTLGTEGGPDGGGGEVVH